MIALVRYQFATMLHAQRYLAPVLLYMGLVGALSSNSPGPLAPLYGTCAGALLFCATWFTIALTSVEEPVHRAITLVAAGRSVRLLLATMAVAVITCIGLTVAGLGLPLVIARRGASPADLLVGTEALLTCAFTGVAIGLVCSRLVFRRFGSALIAALALLAVAALVRGVPPANSLFRLLGSAASSADLAGRSVGYLALSVVLLGLAAVLTQWIAVRRD